MTVETVIDLLRRGRVYGGDSNVLYGKIEAAYGKAGGEAVTVVPLPGPCRIGVCLAGELLDDWFYKNEVAEHNAKVLRVAMARTFLRSVQ